MPDAVVRRADQIELVDMSPEALRRRMAHGNVYPAERVDAAMGNYFRVGNLTALRELALLWLADRVDEGLRRYKAEHDIDHVWEARERVVVALTGGPEGETLIRRPSRVARRARATASCSPSTCWPPTASPAPPRRRCAPSGTSSRASAAPTTRSSATTSPPRCWSSRAASTPPSWSSAPAAARGWARAVRGGIGGAGRRRLRRDRRAHRHPRGGRVPGLAGCPR